MLEVFVWDVQCLHTSGLNVRVNLNLQLEMRFFSMCFFSFACFLNQLCVFFIFFVAICVCRWLLRRWYTLLVFKCCVSNLVVGQASLYFIFFFGFDGFLGMQIRLWGTLTPRYRKISSFLRVRRIFCSSANEYMCECVAKHSPC